MTIQHPIEDEVGQLARRVEKARGRLAYQFDPALTEALSEDELVAERELAEKIRGEDRAQRWKQVQAAASAADRARQTTEAIEKADIRDLLVARKAIAAQRRESSPHAKLASLYRHRGWSLRALAGVVAAGMLWSAVNVQHNIAPGGPGDPLYWFSYLIEAMISVCLIIIMVGTNKVAEWGVIDNRRQVASAEIALLTLTVTLNTYPYLRAGEWYDTGVHAVAPVMIGVALLIHDAASARYGLAIYRATEQVRELPDPAEQIRSKLPTITTYRANALAALVSSESDRESAEPGDEAAAAAADAEHDAEVEGIVEAEEVEVEESTDGVAAGDAVTQEYSNEPRPEKPSNTNGRPVAESGRAPGNPGAAPEPRPAPAKAVPRPVVAKEPAAPVVAKNNPFAPAVTDKPVAPAAETKPVAKIENRPASPQAAKPPARKAAPAPAEKPAPPAESKPAAVSPLRRSAGSSAPVTAVTRKPSPLDGKKDSRTTENARGKVNPPSEPDSHLQVVRTPDIHDTGQFRIAEMLEQELAELQAERRRARASRQR
ncbi:hypothetical protein OG874_42580 [Nocardia sp. NBC_00565]|uniref:hypothetical protein n=1 Tax=Nocardia sp. NBC_00565 TaxID=2975993 RepID=UPI002E806FD4|nr:hypothetical protein [Nocardia sp. NBC_00565]WUC03277.1 hypothetical protein OG874_42580 [Nocardia sp. NBC_00565]